MRCITNTDNRPQGDVELYAPVAVCCCCDYWKSDKRPRVTGEGETRLFDWFSAFGWLREVLPSLSAKQLVKSAPAFCPLSACFLGWKKCTYDGFTAASRHASQDSGLPTRMREEAAFGDVQKEHPPARARCHTPDRGVGSRLGLGVYMQQIADLASSR